MARYRRAGYRFTFVKRALYNAAFDFPIEDPEEDSSRTRSDSDGTGVDWGTRKRLILAQSESGREQMLLLANPRKRR